MRTIKYSWIEWKQSDNLYKLPDGFQGSQKACIAHLSAKKNPSWGWVNANNKKNTCKFCNKDISIANIKKHEKSCNKNPSNFKTCPICSKIFVGAASTCSYSCSNKMFRSGENNTWKNAGNTYRFICFQYHKKECVICGENKILSIHHLNENHKDDRPENLIPLCPTHHQYMHSRYKKSIEPIIAKYIENFNNRSMV